MGFDAANPSDNGSVILAKMLQVWAEGAKASLPYYKSTERTQELNIFPGAVKDTCLAVRTGRSLLNLINF